MKPVFADTSFYPEFPRRLWLNNRTKILAATSDWVSRGLKHNAQRLDKHWSVVDCISFEMMWEEGVQDALTAGHDFTQAGFRALLAVKNT